MILYSNKVKFDSKEITTHLEENRITLKDYNEFLNDLSNFNTNYPEHKIQLHQGTCSYFILDAIKKVKDLKFEEVQTNNIENMKVQSINTYLFIIFITIIY